MCRQSMEPIGAMVFRFLKDLIWSEYIIGVGNSVSLLKTL